VLTRVPFVPPEGFVNLLMSGISPRIQVTPPTYPTLSDYQASFDVFQSRPSQSSEVGTSQIGTAGFLTGWIYNTIFLIFLLLILMMF